MSANSVVVAVIVNGVRLERQGFAGRPKFDRLYSCLRAIKEIHETAIEAVIRIREHSDHRGPEYEVELVDDLPELTAQNFALDFIDTFRALGGYSWLAFWHRGRCLVESETWWPLVKHDGRAEAALIAYYGLRSLNAMAAA